MYPEVASLITLETVSYKKENVFNIGQELGGEDFRSVTKFQILAGTETPIFSQELINCMLCGFPLGRSYRYSGFQNKKQLLVTAFVRKPLKNVPEMPKKVGMTCQEEFRQVL